MRNELLAACLPQSSCRMMRDSEEPYLLQISFFPLFFPRFSCLGFVSVSHHKKPDNTGCKYAGTYILPQGSAPLCSHFANTWKDETDRRSNIAGKRFEESEDLVLHDWYQQVAWHFPYIVATERATNFPQKLAETLCCHN
jgi:hypothetical protein